jgi:hypothetical protein
MRSMCKMCIFVKKFATNENRADFLLIKKHVVLDADPKF